MKNFFLILSLFLLVGLFWFGKIEKTNAMEICWYVFHNGQFCTWCLASPNLGCGPADGEYYNSQPDNSLICKDMEAWGDWASYISWTIKPSIQEVDDGWTWGCEYDYYRSGTKILCSVPIYSRWRGTGIKRTGCKAYKNTPPPACGNTVNNHFLDEAPAENLLCDSGVAESFSYNGDGVWEWTWYCDLLPCQAHQ
ncbi:MAG: hypothetical protein U9P90_03565, partial [Patescibacteria group bacterium]|nr:hypothetical protein [Patescibacteria group bacterium]